MIEIERKYLVTSMAFLDVYQTSNTIAQGYLNSNPERTVRIRIKSDKGFLTIKGIGNASGATRFEWEKGIPIDEALLLLELCEPGVIDKTRFEVKAGKHVFEIDEFYGENAGLIVAEIELQSETVKILSKAAELPFYMGVKNLDLQLPTLLDFRTLTLRHAQVRNIFKYNLQYFKLLEKSRESWIV